MGWRKEGARSFYQSLRGDDLNPRSSFPDPDENDVPTADPRRIANIFRLAWTGVFTRKPDLPADLWPDFVAHYGQDIPRMQEVDAQPLTAVELFTQVRRM